jgi:hypothetical protein
MSMLRKLHTSFSVDVRTKLSEIREAISELNSKGLFEADGMHPFRVRLIDKARLICSHFSKKGLLRQIMDHSDDLGDDVASAFVLGCIATDVHWLRVHEEAVFEGYAHIEGRESVGLWLWQRVSVKGNEAARQSLPLRLAYMPKIRRCVATIRRLPI